MVCSDKPKENFGSFSNYPLVLPKTFTVLSQISRIRFNFSSIRFQALLLILLYMLMEHEYRNFVAPLFQHLNFTYSFNVTRFVIGITIMAAGIMAPLILKPNPFLHAVSVCATLLLLIPNVILYQYMDTDPAIPMIALLFVLLLSVPVPSWKRINRIPAIQPSVSVWIMVLLTIAILIPVIIDFGFRMPNLHRLMESSEQYEIRRETAHSISLFSHYSLGQLLKALIPSVILLGISLKRYWLTVAGCLVLGGLFMVYPHKTTLIMLLPLLLFAFVNDHRKQTGYMLMGLVAAILITVALTAWWNIMPESLLVRRIFFTPAFITHAYTEYFRDTPVFFTHSFMGGIFQYPFELEPAFEISRAYFLSDVMRCNTGFIGDGFLNFGYAGMILFTVLTAVLFQFIAQLKLKPLYFGLSFFILYEISNSSPVTLILTHGLLLLLLIMTFMLRNRQQEML